MRILSYKKKERDQFEALCRKIFKFLERDFGCELISVERDSYGTCISYKNLATAVEIGFKPIDGYVYVMLIRLINGEIPPYEEVKPKITINNFYLLDVVNFYNPTFNLQLPPLEAWLNYQTLKKELNQQAEYLRKYTADILKGDFSIFPELEEIVKKRAGVLNNNKKKRAKKEKGKRGRVGSSF